MIHIVTELGPLSDGSFVALQCARGIGLDTSLTGNPTPMGAGMELA